MTTTPVDPPATRALFPPARPFHVMAKPTGAICNLDCAYCFYLDKESLYPGHAFRMADGVMEAYVRQVVEAHRGAPEVTVAWQGGEPTLMGIDFFRRAVEAAERWTAPGQRAVHTVQTNATLLTDEWAGFLAEHHFLVGVSLDGPRHLHDTYRVDKRGGPTFDKVMRGLDHLRRHGVEHNILCTVNAANADHPEEVYRFFRDECGASFLQFIPIVEHTPTRADPEAVSPRSVGADQFGRFLCGVFDEWVSADVGEVFVQAFDAALASWVGAPPGVCIFAETCGDAVALEHNGDVYSCDHYVEPAHRLGNLTETPLVELVASPGQRRFGSAKRTELPALCRSCDVRFACNGECPKNRFTRTPDGEAGLNYLCAGYLRFFHHIDGPMRLMAELLGQGRPAEDVMALFAHSPRNAPCPCGSGTKTKLCHGGRRR